MRFADRRESRERQPPAFGPKVLTHGATVDMSRAMQGNGMPEGAEAEEAGGELPSTRSTSLRARSSSTSKAPSARPRILDFGPALYCRVGRSGVYHSRTCVGRTPNEANEDAANERCV
jgi:hypothetical protein